MAEDRDTIQTTDANPELRGMALNALGSSSGWGVFCRRFDEIIAKNLDAKIFDPKTTDEERRTLVNARAFLTESYTPEKIRKSLLVVAETETARIQREKAQKA